MKYLKLLYNYIKTNGFYDIRQAAKDELLIRDAKLLKQEVNKWLKFFNIK